MLEISLFSIFALIAVVTAVLVITRKNPIMSALFLVLNFFSLAGLYLLLNAQFIAVVQVIVYAGAIMVLFLFVLMLLNFQNEPDFKEKAKSKVKQLAILLGVAFVFELGYVLSFSKLSGIIKGDNIKSVNIGKIENIGSVLYTDYSLPFIAAGFLLIAATMGAIILAKKKFD